MSATTAGTPVEPASCFACVARVGAMGGACYAIGTEFHTWQLVAQGKTPAAHKGMVHAAKVLKENLRPEDF